jgi:Tfp pilus assembly protein PilX
MHLSANILIMLIWVPIVLLVVTLLALWSEWKLQKGQKRIQALRKRIGL